MDETKYCGDCRLGLPLSAFFPRKGHPGKHLAICRTCRRLRVLRSYQTDETYRRRTIKRACESSKRRRMRPEVREQERFASREAKRRLLADPAERAAHNERGRRWRAENDYRARFKHEQPALKAAKTMLRYARKLKATPPWVDQKAISAIYVEAARLTAETGVEHQVDHIWPLAGRRSCGLHVPWNLQVITATENRLKSNREPEPIAFGPEWTGELCRKAFFQPVDHG